MISSKLPDVGTTIFTVMSKMAVDSNAINLSQGFPDFDVDPRLCELVTEAMKKGYNQYSPMPGHPLLRKRIAESLNVTYGWKGDPDKNITVTAGATEGLFAAFSAIVDKGDEVIIFEPAYDSYAPAIRLNGGIPVPIHLNPSDFSIPRDKLLDKVGNKTKAIVINTPHNPSGSVLTRDDIDFIADLVDLKGLFLISDEVYHRIIFDGLEHHTSITHEKLKDRSIAVFSFGKTFHATGWKIGYVVAPESITVEIRKMHQFLTFAVNTPMQWAIAEFLKDKSNYLGLSSFYEEKRDYFRDLIKDSAFKIKPCHGTYFQLLSYDDITNQDDLSYSELLTKEKKIASIPVSVFYSDKKDHHHLRFCFAKNNKTLEAAAEILCRI